MPRSKKTERFRALSKLPHVLEKPTGLAGHWSEHFPSAQPLVVELGCGYGEYTVSLAQRYPERNYIGMDIQGERLWRGATASLQLKLTNVWWLRGQIDHLLEYFAPGEIAEIWLTFPDPYPKDRQAKKRLTSPRFLKMYQTVLKPGGKIQLKTDARPLLEYTQEIVEQSGAQLDILIENVAAEETAYDLDIKTRFELKHRTKNEPIYYLAWYWS